jgi:hypothetical protein
MTRPVCPPPGSPNGWGSCPNAHQSHENGYPVMRCKLTGGHPDDCRNTGADMTKPINIMIDLETWGKKPGCDIRSIGACVFDPLTGETCGVDGLAGIGPSDTPPGTFYIAIDNPGVTVEDAQVWFDDGLVSGWAQDVAYPHYDRNGFMRRYNLQRDPETVQWWSEQSDEAQAAFADPVELREACERFGHWIAGFCPNGVFDAKRDSHIHLWSHGPAFDVAILAAVFDAVGLPVPWHYRAPRDTRTAFDMAGIADHSAFMQTYNYGTAHHALHDAISQSMAVNAAYAIVDNWRQGAIHRDRLIAGRTVRLVEEVPGVPETDRYFIWNGRPGKVWNGPTKEAGEQWALKNGITIDAFEPFEP